MSKFIIIQFLETKEIELISSNWLEGTSCSWPPYKISKFKIALINHEMPGENWETSDVKLLECHSSYENAKIALARKGESPDQDTQENCSCGNRKRRKLENGTLSNVTTQPCITKVISKKSDVLLDKTSEILLDKTSIKAFQDVIMKELNELKSLILKNTETLNAILYKLHPKTECGNKETPTVEPPELLNLPITRHEELVKYELEMMGNPMFMETLVKRLSELGGANLGNCVRRMLSYLLTDDLAAQFTWLGTKEKDAFNNLMFWKAIIAAVRKVPKYKDQTDADIEFVVKNWLRHANDRRNKVKEEMNTSCASPDNKSRTKKKCV